MILIFCLGWSVWDLISSPEPTSQDPWIGTSVEVVEVGSRVGGELAKQNAEEK